MSINTLEEIFHPQAIAVVGASGDPTTSGYHFTRHLLDYGYRGRIYLVNPNRSEVLGIKAYPSLRDIPRSISYVICCIPAPGVLSLLEDCAQKRVKAVHLFTARFSETGRSQAAELENEILKRAKKGVSASLVQTAWASIIPEKDFPLAMTSPGSQGRWEHYFRVAGQLPPLFI